MLHFPAFITLRAGPPTRLSIPRLRLHTSSSTSYLGPPLLIYISLGVLSLDPGGAWGRSITLCGFVFFFVRCSPQPLDPSTCVAVPQAVGKQWPRFARPFRTHPKRPSMATEWQKNDNTAVYVVVRVIWYARPTVFLTPRWLLDHPKRKMIQNDVLTSKIVGFDSSKLKITQN